MPFQLRLVIELLFTVVADVHHSREITRQGVIGVDVVVQWCQVISFLLDHNHGQLMLIVVVQWYQDISFLLDHNHGQLMLVEGRHVDSESLTLTLSVM